jgi:hypothetical protein
MQSNGRRSKGNALLNSIQIVTFGICVKNSDFVEGVNLTETQEALIRGGSDFETGRKCACT